MARLGLQLLIVLFIWLGFFLPGIAVGQTLLDALVSAYRTNSSLEAARAGLRATDEQVPLAKSGYRPVISADADIGRTKSETKLGDYTSNPASVSLGVVQPIYRGGRTMAAVGKAKKLVNAERAKLLASEQQVLLDAATAYFDVLQNQAIVDLNFNNEKVLAKQLDASRARFKAGAVTRTDVSQSEARFSRAVSDRIAAEGILETSKAVFLKVTGMAAERLEQPSMNFPVPANYGDVISKAREENPSVVAAQFSEMAARKDIDLVRGELLPEAGLEGSVTKAWDQGPLTGDVESAQVVAKLHVPLYEAGSVSARVREAKHNANRRRIEVEEARRAADELATRAWQALVTARAEIKSRQAQVTANRSALEGVMHEARAGSRTVLDILDAEQEFRDSQVQFVRAKRNEAVATFNVLAAMGQLTAEGLNLPVDYYDPEKHYDEVKNTFWGTGIDEGN